MECKKQCTRRIHFNVRPVNVYISRGARILIQKQNLYSPKRNRDNNLAVYIFPGECSGNIRKNASIDFIVLPDIEIMNVKSPYPSNGMKKNHHGEIFIVLFKAVTSEGYFIGQLIFVR